MVVHISHLLLPSWRNGCTRPAKLRQGCLFLTQVSRFLQRQSIFRADIFCRLTDQLLRPCTKCYAISSGSVQTTGPLSLVDRKYRVHLYTAVSSVTSYSRCRIILMDSVDMLCGRISCSQRFVGGQMRLSLQDDTHHTCHHPTAPRTF